MKSFDAFQDVVDERDRLREDKRKCVHALGYILTNPAEAQRVARHALSMVTTDNPEVANEP